MSTTVGDFKFGIRSLLRQPVFVIVAVVSLALGVGANGAIFSMVNALIFQEPPGVEAPDELVRVYSLNRGFDWPLGVSAPNATDLEEATGDLFDGFAGHAPVTFGVAWDGSRPSLAWGNVTKGDYFGVLGAVPARGVLYGERAEAEREQVVVLSHDYWQRTLGGRDDIVGSTLSIDGTAFVVTAVMAEEFFGTDIIFQPDLWVPATTVERAQEALLERNSDMFRMTGRLRDGVDMAAVSSRLEVLTENLAEYEENEAVSFAAMPAADAQIEAGMAPALKLMAAILMGLVGLVLLIACANVMNLLLVRASGRRRELSLRVAIGAGRRHLIRQMLIESLFLCTGGAVLGAVIARIVAVGIGSAPMPTGVPLRLDLSPDLTVYVFVGLVAIAAGVTFSLLPALRSSKADVVSGLKGVAGAATRQRTGALLVVAQVALSLILLVGAGLFLRSLSKAQAVDLGIDPTNVATLTVNTSLLGKTDEESQIFFREALERMREIPGVENATAVSWAPLDWNARGTYLDVGRDLGEDRGTQLLSLGSWVSDDYFKTMSTRLVEGRVFDRGIDRADTEGVIIVNEAFARQAWGSEPALGKRLRLPEYDDREVLVVGVAETGKYRLLGESPRPYVFLSMEQFPTSAASFLLKSSVPLRGVIDQASEIIHSREPDLAIQNPNSFEFMVTSRALGPIQMVAILAGGFGAIGLVLAAIGLYGVIAFGVAQRRREIGLRLAVGASETQVLKGVVARGVRLTAMGLLVGIPLSLVATRVLGSFLIDTQATDLVTYLAVAFLLFLVAVGSSLAPAVRAARVDPVSTLRADG